MTPARDPHLPVPGEVGRSTLLRAGQPAERRHRAWAMRYLGVATVLTAIGLVAVIVGGVWFSTDGPWRAIYYIHDRVWLPLHGWAWTAIYPDGLIWLVVVLGVLVLALAEYLGAAILVRRAQAGLLRVGLTRVPELLVGWHVVLGLVGLRAGLAEAVLREMRDTDLRTLTEGNDRDAKAQIFRRLAGIQQLQIRLGINTPRDLVAIVDILGLATLDPQTREEAAGRLRRAAITLAPDDVPDWGRIGDKPPFGTGIVDGLDSVSTLTDPQLSPEALACRTIGVALSIMADRQPERMAWFDAWARLRVGKDAETAQRLALAESCCAFEFWAAQAETSLQTRQVSPFLANAFRDLSSIRPRGEIFAAQGEMPKDAGK